MKGGFSKPRIIFDTGPLLKLFIRQDGWETVEKILTCIENGQVEGAVSVATLSEIYCVYITGGKGEMGKARVQDIRCAPYLRKIDISEEIAVKAGEFKGKHNKISLADALIAASAYYDDLILISSDADFERIHEVITMTEKEFLSHIK